jgi:flagellar assembly protein FliH
LKLLCAGLTEMAALYSNDTAAAVPIWSLSRGTGFTAWGKQAQSGEPPADHANHADEAPVLGDPADDSDRFDSFAETTDDITADAPLFTAEELQTRAFAEGYAEGEQAAQAQYVAERLQLAELISALDVLRPEPPRDLGILLAETVYRLVKQIMGEVRIDPQALSERVAAAAEEIADLAGPKRLKMHPADLALLDGVMLDGIEQLADPHLPQGTLILEAGEGTIEDGPDIRLERLRACLDRIGLGR